MTNDCLFCRIARGEIACHAVHEEEDVLAFLDIHPIRPGHTLVIPRTHFPWFEDIPPALAGKIMTLSQRLAREMKALYPVERVAMLYTGIHVNHAHAHLVPMHHRHDITSAVYLEQGVEEFTLPAQPPARELEGVAAALRGRLTS